jgi:hypothetical protein
MTRTITATIFISIPLMPFFFFGGMIIANPFLS